MEHIAVWEYASVRPDDTGTTLTLSVPLSGPVEGVGDEWKCAFEEWLAAVATKSVAGSGGPIRCEGNGQEVQVLRVAEGSEAPLRQFVDSCVDQAIRDCQRSIDEARRAADENEKVEAAQRDASERMTARLRGAV